jgi:O-acetyl-ADP-ribose deacetylase
MPDTRSKQPKKKKRTTTVKVPHASKATAKSKSKPATPKKKTTQKGKKKKVLHPTYPVMVRKAIEAQKTIRKGVSAHAIFKYIISRYGLESPNQPHLRLVLKKGVENGTLKRVKASYKLGRKEPKKNTSKKSTAKKSTTKKVTPKKTTSKKKVEKAKPTKRKASTPLTPRKSGNMPSSSSSSISIVPTVSIVPVSAPIQKSKSISRGSKSKDEEIQDVFDEFFKTFDINAIINTPWNSPESRAQRLQRRKDLWTREVNRPRGIESVDLSTIPSLAVDPRRQQVRGLASFLEHSPLLDTKISVFNGTIYHLKIDAVANATDSNMSGGGGLDAAIHVAAGPLLKEEIRVLDGCPVGYTEITRGYHLPARYILHCAGPRNADARKLATCYITALELASIHGLRTIAFPCIATGSFGFPIEASAQIALQTVRKWLETGDNASHIDRIIFVMFRKQEEKAYFHYIPSVFPPPSAVPVRQLVRTSSLERGDESRVRQNVELLNQWIPRVEGTSQSST